MEDTKAILKNIQVIDEKLSERFIFLDPSGYFLIKLQKESQEIILEHYSNEIDENGIAIDPDSGKPIECSSNEKRSPNKIFIGKSAKEIGIKISEGNGPHPISRLDHALYIGRELQKAEFSLAHNLTYIQD